jgi:hypothetical protein
VGRHGHLHPLTNVEDIRVNVDTILSLFCSGYHSAFAEIIFTHLLLLLGKLITGLRLFIYRRIEPAVLRLISAANESLDCQVMA